MPIQAGKLAQGSVKIGIRLLIFVEAAKHLARTVRHSAVLRQVPAFTVIRTILLETGEHVHRNYIPFDRY